MSFSHRRSSLGLSIVAIVALAAASAAVLGGESSRPASDGYPLLSIKSQILRSDGSLRFPLRASQQVRVTVTSSVEPGPALDGYTYTYTVASEASNSVGIEAFGLRLVPPPDSATSPEQWEDFYGHLEEDSAVVWACTDRVTDAPPGWDSAQVYPSPFDIQPGESKTFVMYSKRPPIPSVEYRVLGFETIPPVGVYSTGQEGRADYPSMWRVGVTGNAWGPDIRSVVGVGADRVPDKTGELRAPAPNPTEGSASIAFSLARRSRVDLSVYDARGRLIETLIRAELPAGFHSSSWAGQTAAGGEAASGVYFFRLRVDGVELGKRKVVLVR
jgi:hypothetical protein